MSHLPSPIVLHSNHMGPNHPKIKDFYGLSLRSVTKVGFIHILPPIYWATFYDRSRGELQAAIVQEGRLISDNLLVIPVVFFL